MSGDSGVEVDLTTATPGGLLASGMGLRASRRALPVDTRAVRIGMALAHKFVESNHTVLERGAKPWPTID